jgi:hypothetical protein
MIPMSDSDVQIRVGVDAGPAIEGAQQARDALATVTPQVNLLTRAFEALGKTLKDALGQVGRTLAHSGGSGGGGRGQGGNAGRSGHGSASSPDAAAAMQSFDTQQLGLVSQLATEQLGTPQFEATLAQANAVWQAFQAQRVQAAASAEGQIANGERNLAATSKREWGRIVDPIVASWGTAVVKLVEGTETFHQALVHVGQSILQTFVRAVEQMVEQWIVNLLVGKTVQQQTAASQIGSYAGVAGAAGVSSMAGAPPPLNLTAPAFGAAMAGAALAFASFSAAGGFDVPAGMNPLTQLHAQEMVLPARLANPMRDMLARFGGAGRGGGAGGDAHLHYAPTIHAPPSASLRQMLTDQGSDMVAFVQSALRDGSLRL